MTPVTESPDSSHLPEKPWALTPEDSFEALDASSEGLTSAEASRRLSRFGPNQLKAPERRSSWAILAEQFRSVIVGLLAAAMLVSMVLGEGPEAVAIGVVIVINTVVGFVTELRAVRSMESLRQLGRVDTTVRRDGEAMTVPAENLVPGDIVLVEGGAAITADMRVVDAWHLEADESALTGESLSVTKSVEAVEEDRVLAERGSMLHKGTAVTNGSGECLVVGTGMQTELGNISKLVEESTQPETPLQIQLAQLGHRLLWVTLGIAVLIGLLGAVSGRPVRETIETAIALAVAAIPEGLPIVATVALARGMRRMASRNVLIEKLAAVETLGSVGVILTDKTGTLTENEMVLAKLVTPEGEYEFTGGFATEGEVEGGPLDSPDLVEALKIGALCANASVGHDNPDEVVGDPSEVALIMGAMKAGIDRIDLLAQMPELSEEAFDPEERMMATLHQDGDRRFWAVKGAPEAVLESCDGSFSAEEWMELNAQLAASGLRVLALATREASDETSDPYRDLTFLGLAGLVDPPRSDVGDAIAEAHGAGVDVVMVTGDQSSTASSIASDLGIDPEKAVTGQGLSQGDVSTQEVETAHVFARTSPEQKLDLIVARQEAGERVAMIGDGVNDAPALKRADIGVAMGQRGTDVAKEAADVVVQDDRFGSIVDAIREGRIIFENIRRFVVYLLSSNLSEVVVVAIGSVLALPAPILPLQILYLNLITDVFPALALGASKGDSSVMERPPRPADEGVLTRAGWIRILTFGLVISIPVLGILFYSTSYLGLDSQTATTMSFMTLALAQLWHVFNMAGADEPLVSTQVTRNPWVWAALAVSAGLLLIVMYVPALSGVMEVSALTGSEWSLVVGFSLVPLLFGHIARARLG